MAIRKVVLASDGSENSLRAAEYAGQLLAGNAEVQVVVAYVAEPPARMEPIDFGGTGVRMEVPMDVIIRRHAERILTSTEQALGLPKRQVQAEVLVGRPAEELVILARAIAADLIVVGRRGLTGWKELFMGSVSNRLVHSAPCPVLVVQ